MKGAPRLPWAPLEHLLRAQADLPDPTTGWCPSFDPHVRLWSDRVAGEMLGVHIRQIMRWKTEGLSPKAADKAATAVDLHIELIWGGDAWDDAEHARHARHSEVARQTALRNIDGAEAA